MSGGSRSIPAALLEHLRGDTATLALCWQISLADGTFIRGTDHDQNITIDVIGSPATGREGTYRAGANIASSDIALSADMSVSNLEVNGAFPLDTTIPDLTPAIIESGVADYAPAVLFMVNWQSPNDGQVVLVSGTLGEFNRDSNGAYRTEVRSLSQSLAQNIGTTYGDRCDVKRFGDSRCGLNVAALARTATVTDVTDRTTFTVALTPSTEPPTETYFSLGVARFTSGDADGFERNIKSAVFSTGGSLLVTLWEELPVDLANGDTLAVEPGCDRLFTTCKVVHNNAVNFHGYGLFIPGMDAIMAGPDGAKQAGAVSPLQATIGVLE